MPEGKLRDALIATAKSEGKPYGLWFSDIQGGYTITDRSGPQAFKVLPMLVYRVWTEASPRTESLAYIGGAAQRMAPTAMAAGREKNRWMT